MGTSFREFIGGGWWGENPGARYLSLPGGPIFVGMHLGEPLKVVLVICL